MGTIYANEREPGIENDSVVYRVVPNNATDLLNSFLPRSFPNPGRDVSMGTS